VNKISTNQSAKEIIMNRFGIVSLLAVAIFTCPLATPAKAVTLYVGTETGDYATIQEAVTAASVGDIILIRAGIYIEDVIVDNYVTPGDNLSGSHDRTNLTITRAQGAAVSVKSPQTWGDIFKIQSDGVTIEGLDIYGTLDSGYTSTIGIHLDGADNCTIRNNRCSWDPNHRTQFGIYLSGEADNNLIEENICSHTTNVGIYLHGSHYNRILQNQCNYARNYYGSEEGIRLYASSSNIIANNTCNGNPRGIEIYYNCANTSIMGNTCNSNINGLYIYWNTNAVVVDNTITGNKNGIYHTTSSYSLISSNRIYNNTQYGMYIFNSSSYNRIYLNKFSNNTTANLYLDGGSGNATQAHTQLSYFHNAVAHKGNLGNRYDDYDGNDADGDGIGDTAYSGSTYTDNYPLIADPERYTFRTWFLGNPIMYGNDPAQKNGRYEVPASGSVVWVADQPANLLTTFAAGSLGDETAWTYQLFVEESWQSPASNLTLILGHANGNGSD
jgi:nitrous oxidase accessory protein